MAALSLVSVFLFPLVRKICGHKRACSLAICDYNATLLCKLEMPQHDDTDFNSRNTDVPTVANKKILAGRKNFPTKTFVNVVGVFFNVHQATINHEHHQETPTETLLPQKTEAERGRTEAAAHTFLLCGTKQAERENAMADKRL